jgi:hypothetical protein
MSLKKLGEQEGKTGPVWRVIPVGEGRGEDIKSVRG